MANVRVKFFGKSKATGGYAQATRYIAQGFAGSDAKVNFAENNSFFKKLSDYSGKCDISFMIGTPPFSRYKSKSYKIGYFYWETDKLPSKWAADIRSSLDEIWVPCELTKKACRKAGFRGPIEVVFTPRPKELGGATVALPSYGDKNFVVNDDTFIFYSLFQWNERKGYATLFRAFLEEFSANEDVILVVKTNPIDHYNHGLPKIVSDTRSFRAFARKKLPPSVFLITDILPQDDIAGLHSLGDCFVLPHHGEGWGMPIHDAMMHESLVLTTGFGGITEHLCSESAFLINHKLVPTTPMNWNPYYCGDQMWAEPDLMHLRYLMRKAYEGRLAGYGDIVAKAKEIAESMSIAAFSEKVNEIFSSRRFDFLGVRSEG